MPPATSQMLADLCGVSRATIYRALNNKGYVQADVKRQIQKKARELGYSPNYLASSLKKGQTKSIGVIVFDLYNPFFAYMVNHIEQVARAQHYSINIMLTDKDPTTEIQCINSMVARRVDGIIIDPVNREERINKLNLSVPLIALGNKLSDQYPFVGIDDFQAQKEAFELAYSKGYRRFVYVCTALRYAAKTNIWAQAERMRGFLAGISEHDISDEQFTVLSGRDYLDKIKELIRSTKEKIAILCSSDIIAINILENLKKDGFRIPSDVGIMGFDNINISSYTEPRLSTVNHSLDLMAESAFSVLLQSLDSEDRSQRCIIPHSIINGQSL